MLRAGALKDDNAAEATEIAPGIVHANACRDEVERAQTADVHGCLLR